MHGATCERGHREQGGEREGPHCALPVSTYFGGKGRWAEEIIQRLGYIEVYVEPFAGSLAVLLNAPPRKREITCDLDGMIANFWRAVQNDPEAVAYHADYPTFHDDLLARRKWLAQWSRDNADTVRDDAEFYDAKAAGWWAWAVSNWIGTPTEMLWGRTGELTDTRPMVGTRGVSALAFDKRPHAGTQGVQVQRDKIPQVNAKFGGRGTQATRTDTDGDIGTGERLLPWMQALAQRLARVIVLNRSWESAVTPTLLLHTKQGPKPPVGIFLDPPYKLEKRRNLYGSDKITGDEPAEASYKWAVDHGAVYKIAYACHEGDFPLPEGWTTGGTKSFSGQYSEHRDKTRDVVFYSPACDQTMLF